MNPTVSVLPDGLREALGQVIANERREWRRERELIESQSRETIADLRSRIVEFEKLIERMVADRFVALKDGAPGRDGVDGKDGRDGIDGKDGVDGKDGAPGADGLPGRDGKDGVDGKDGADGRSGADGKDGAPGRDGERGERGETGPQGSLASVEAWFAGVHYAGNLRTHNGSTFQAACDTAMEPPGDDWICIARAGADGCDGRSLNVAKTFDPTKKDYQELDVVALNGGSFVARKDNPGVCPGEDWQLLASPGKQGKPGERGVGPRGERGMAGAPVTALEIDHDGMLTLRNGDGSIVTCDLYPLLSKLAG